MTEGCGGHILDAVNIALAVFLFHSLCYQPWWSRLGFGRASSLLIALPPAIGAGLFAFERYCDAFGAFLQFPVVGVAPLTGIAFLTIQFRKRGFPAWRRGFPAALFATAIMMPFLGGLCALGWYLMSWGLPNLLYLPPEENPDLRSVREKFAGVLFTVLFLAGIGLLALARSTLSQIGMTP
jgi:hypothetical protein